MDNEVNKTTETIAETGAEAAETEKAAPKKQKISEWDGWKGWVRDILTCFLIAGLILSVIKPTIVRQHSMENTLIAGDYLILSRHAYSVFGEPERGDIIVFRSDLATANGGDKLLIKRVIGLPGETVEITGGIVYINGEPLDEPYLKDGYTKSEMGEIIVPQDNLFCMGDNRQNSVDSRSATVGYVPLKRVVGKAVIRLFPFNKFGGLYKDLPY